MNTLILAITFGPALLVLAYEASQRWAAVIRLGRVQQ